MANKKRGELVPVWEKSNLTLEEAAAYFNIGINRIRELANENEDVFVLWVGSRRMIKRKKLEEFLDERYSV
jgi:excisionase family DNA binding protein